MINNLFLSVGAMKAGTTWLYEQLKEHPEIYFTPEKEIHYFANKQGIEEQLSHRNRLQKMKYKVDDIAHGNLKFLEHHIEEISWYSEFARPRNITDDWYENLFRFRNEEKYCCDFSNLYCQMDKKGWDNVKKVSKNIRVIYTLRDPLKRLWSHYKFHMLWVDKEDETLDIGFQQFKELLDKHWFWINAEYIKNYKLLKENLKDNELMLLYFEDFRANPVKMIKEVQDFLGIENITTSKEKLNKQVNKTKDFDIPEEWLKYMQVKLKPLYKEMKESGIGHKKWLTY